jgi:hypothetical protein
VSPTATTLDSHSSQTRRRFPTRVAYAALILLFLVAAGAGAVGQAVGAGVLHPANLNPNRSARVEAMLLRTGAAKKDFLVRASNGVELLGWKIRARTPSANWVLLFHGVSDNRTGAGHAAALGHVPAEYENRVASFFGKTFGN